jgi:glycosyltransferase involved in cell wall biosynthesis
MRKRIMGLEQNPKVLFFATITTWDGGASRALRATVKRVAAAGVKPLVVIPEGVDSLEMFPKSEFDVVYLNIQRPRRTWNPLVHARFMFLFPSTFLSLRHLIKQREIQLVHFNELTDFIAGIAAASCGVPSVCHVRSHRLSNPYRWALLTTLKAIVGAVVVPSRYTAEWIKADSVELSERVRLIYDYAWEDTGLEASQSGADFRRELGLTRGQILVVLVSKLVPLKGHECFIRAAQRVLKTSKDVSFVIVGGPVQGRVREAATIKALGEELTPAPGLRFFGSRKDLGPIYSAADIVVHCPTYPDTYPTVVLLPMFVGKAIIGSDIGGIPEQIEHDKTGILVPPNDPGALADAILELAGDPAKRESLGIAARKTIRERWAPETQGRLLAELYAEVIKGNSQNGNHRHSP